MSDLLKVAPIYIVLFIANLWVAFFNVTFWLSKLKSGIYTLPLSRIPLVNLVFQVDPVFENWGWFTLAVWTFNGVFCFIWVTLMVGWAYKYSADNYGVLISAFIIGQIMSVVAHLFFLYLKARELPTRYEAIGLILLIGVSLLIIRPAK